MPPRTPSTTTQHDAWLRRLSDYHSGDVDEAERAAVEAHLATCAECRAALALYRRFYTLAATPSRLGHPSADIATSRSRRWAGQPGGGAQLPRTLTSVVAIAAVIALIVGFVALLGPRFGLGNPPANATRTPGQPTATLAHTPTPAPTIDVAKLPPMGTGYVIAGPAWAQFVVAAPSAPDTLYSCGNEHPLPFGQPGSILSVAASTDGGRTWQTSQTSIVGSYCSMTVDPTNASHLLLQATDVYTSADTDILKETPPLLYQSRDAARNWSEARPPSNTTWVGVASVWVGSSVFHATSTGLARSSDGAPFALVPGAPWGDPLPLDENSNCLSGDAQVESIYVVGTNLYISFHSSDCGTQYTRLDSKTDQWTTVHLNQGGNGDTTNAHPITLLAVSPDGHTFVGQDDDGQFVRSRNGGATWEKLPAAPPQLSCCSLLTYSTTAVANDGTVYTLFYEAGPDYYLLAHTPDANTWRLLAPGPKGESTLHRAALIYLTFVFDTQGRPTAIWAVTLTDTQTYEMSVYRL